MKEKRKAMKKLNDYEEPCLLAYTLNRLEEEE